MRVIRACRELGIASVSVHSEADVEAPHAQEADETYLVGPARVFQSYLDMEKIISTAMVAGADAIHPGYGLLSENPRFPEACQKAGIVFIGPPVAAIQSMGMKTEARKIMQQAGIPVVPGCPLLETAADAAVAAQAIGYPVMVKASAGGGGIGMQIVHGEADLEKAFTLCRSRAQAAFASPDVYLEKYVRDPRHIEIQVFADGAGRVVHLGERECSIQRRHQKIMEESPSPLVTAEMRRKLGEDAVKAAQAIDYVGAGTVEFLADGDRNYYFLEMNTRLQVEHPVTEMVTGIDLVIEQIRVAAGNPLLWTQDDIRMSGHALECRIYAEDPEKNFRPSTGTITRLFFPKGESVRADAGISEGYKVTPFYDPMLAKIIVKAPDRSGSLNLMTDALKETVIEGVKTNVPLLLEVLAHPEFQAGRLTTDFIGRYFN